jgi:hypothetical protein
LKLKFKFINPNLPIRENIYVREENVSRKALQKRKRREKKAIKKGRIPGVVGRPPVVDNETAEIIKKTIKRDVDEGNFHDIHWLREFVFYFIYFFLLKNKNI